MKRLLPFVLLLVVVSGIYAPAVRNEFVWDDQALVLRDPLIRSWRLLPEGFQHFLFTDATASDFYRPIQRLTYTLEYAAFGFAPAAYHASSVLCHLLAAAALLCFARELLKRLQVNERTREVVSLLATVAWAAHPVHSSAVAYVSGRADPLAALFGFAGLFLALRSLHSAGTKMWLFTGSAALALLLSGLSKEAGLIFLALWLSIVFMLRDRKATMRASAAIVLILASYFSLRIPAEHIAPPEPGPVPGLVRPIVTARAVAEYACLILFPLHLHMERDVETHPSGFGEASMSGAAWRELQTLAGVVLLAAFAFWLFRQRKADPAVFLLLLLTALSYLPVSGLITLNATVAEHWLYLPTAFFFLAIGLHAARVLERNAATSRLLRPVGAAALAAWIAFLGSRTFMRTSDWKDQRTFLEQTIAGGGDSARMLINLGGLELAEGRLDKAKKHLQAGLKKNPNEPLALINLAAVAVKENDFATAHELLARAKEIPLVAAQAHELLTVVENKETGRANLLRMRLATRTGAASWPIEKRYVRLLAEGGASNAAIAELQQCLTTQWYRAESWQLLAEVFAQAGRTHEADAALAQAKLYDVHLPSQAKAL